MCECTCVCECVCVFVRVCVCVCVYLVRKTVEILIRKFTKFKTKNEIDKHIYKNIDENLS